MDTLRLTPAVCPPEALAITKVLLELGSDSALELTKVLLELRIIVDDGLFVLVVALNFRNEGSNSFDQADQESPQCVQAVRVVINRRIGCCNACRL